MMSNAPGHRAATRAYPPSPPCSGSWINVTLAGTRRAMSSYHTGSCSHEVTRDTRDAHQRVPQPLPYSKTFMSARTRADRNSIAPYVIHGSGFPPASTGLPSAKLRNQPSWTSAPPRRSATRERIPRRWRTNRATRRGTLFPGSTSVLPRVRLVQDPSVVGREPGRDGLPRVAGPHALEPPLSKRPRETSVGPHALQSGRERLGAVLGHDDARVSDHLRDRPGVGADDDTSRGHALDQNPPEVLPPGRHVTRREDQHVETA